jgi:type I restriction enzyme M protein
LDNDAKVSTYIYDAFCGRDDRPIHKDLTAHISRTRLVDLITFDRVEFEKTISTNVKKKMRVESKWEVKKLGELVENLDNKRVPLSQRERKK